jgi:hypothetical protein
MFLLWRAKSPVEIPKLGTVYHYLHRDLVRGRLGGFFASDETAPVFVAFVDDTSGVALVLGLAGEGELVLGLAIGDLVNPVMSEREREIAKKTPISHRN